MKLKGERRPCVVWMKRNDTQKNNKQEKEKKKKKKKTRWNKRNGAQNPSQNWSKLYPTHTHTQHGWAQWKSITFPFDLLFKSENYYSIQIHHRQEWLSGEQQYWNKHRSEERKKTAVHLMKVWYKLTPVRSKNSNSPNSKIEWKKNQNILLFFLFSICLFVFQSASHTHTHTRTIQRHLYSIRMHIEHWYLNHVTCVTLTDKLFHLT